MVRASRIRLMTFCASLLSCVLIACAPPEPLRPDYRAVGQPLVLDFSPALQFPGAPLCKKRVESLLSQ
jgi:hypothetical protein